MSGGITVRYFYFAGICSPFVKLHSTSAKCGLFNVLCRAATAMQVKDEHLEESGSITAQAPQDVLKPDKR